MKPCAICGAQRTFGHHEDYRKPTDLLWLCGKHHGLLHADRYGFIHIFHPDESRKLHIRMHKEYHTYWAYDRRIEVLPGGKTRDTVARELRNRRRSIPPTSPLEE